MINTQGQFAGDSADIRTILNYKVSPTVLHELLPKGWEPRVETSGAAEGANLRVTFVIPLSGHDAAGNPAPNIRYGIFSIPVKRPGSGSTSELMLFTGLTNGGKGPYQTNVNSKDTIVQKAHYEGASMIIEEFWDFVGDDGSAVSLQMEYTRGRVVPNTAEARVFSWVNPEFSRIYKYEEGVDVVRASNVPQERLKNFTFHARGEKLSRLFDGNEQLISIVALPWYNRKIYLPVA